MELRIAVGSFVIVALVIWFILDYETIVDWFIESIEPHNEKDQWRYYQQIGDAIAQCKNAKDITRVNQMIDSFENWNRDESGRNYVYQLRLMVNRRSARLSMNAT